MDSIAPEGKGIVCGSRKPAGWKKGDPKYAKYMYPSIKKLKQKLAYEIRIIGLQKKPQENDVGNNRLAAAKEQISGGKSSR